MLADEGGKMSSTDEAEKRDVSGVIAPPPLIYVGFLLAGLALDWLFGDTLRILLAAILLIAGIALMVLGGSRFAAAGTNIQTRKPTTALVTSGIYRYTRNPIYLGMTLIYMALSLFADSSIALAGLPVVLAVIRYGVIAREESYLEAKFGAEYQAYKSAVRRWV
jgi:protein-S-isoprenylcysteine O-methyltransferase Ste14